MFEGFFKKPVDAEVVGSDEIIVDEPVQSEEEQERIIANVMAQAPVVEKTQDVVVPDGPDALKHNPHTDDQVLQDAAAYKAEYGGVMEGGPQSEATPETAQEELQAELDGDLDRAA